MPIVNSPVSSHGPVIELYVHVSAPRLLALNAANQAVPTAMLVNGLIDTGASCTSIDPAVVQQLALTPTGTIPIYTPSTGPTPHICNQFDVSLWLPGHNIKKTVPVIESRLANQGIDILVGRDVLDDCVLIYNGPAQLVTLAFK